MAKKPELSKSYQTDRPTELDEAVDERLRLSERPQRKKRKNGGVGQIAGIMAIVLLGCVGAYAGYLYRSKALHKYLYPVISNVTVASEFPNTDSINLMIIGRDYDYDNRDNVIKSNARSDMLMVAHLDFANKSANLLSIPRDTAAAIPGHGITKINAAHAFGGPSLTAATIEQNFGIKPDHYVALDFDGFQQAINLMGGVDCTIDRKMDYDDNWGHLHIHLLPGLQHLNGEQAMDFVRFRHADSDLVRTKRQQALLAELKQKLIQPQTLAVLPELLDTIDKHIDSDLTSDQKVAVARFIHDLPAESVQMQTCPSIEGPRLVETNYALAAPLIKSWFGVDMPQPVGREIARRPRIRHRHHLPIDRTLDVT